MVQDRASPRRAEIASSFQGGLLQRVTRVDASVVDTPIAHDPCKSGGPMAKLTLDQVRDALPDFDELRPLYQHLLMRSEPDPQRKWAGSGRLGTAGSRTSSTDQLQAASERILTEQAAHQRLVYGALIRSLDALARGDLERASGEMLEAAALEEERDRFERAEGYAAAAYRLARDANDPRPMAIALRRWARAARTKGDLSNALDRYTRGFDAARALSDIRGAAEAAVGAGNVLEDQGRWSEAAEWYQTALRELATVGDVVPERWHALLCLHIVARSRGDIEESVGYFDAAEREANTLEPDMSRPFLQNARGQLAMAAGAFVEAEDHFRRALKTAPGPKARITIGVNLAEALLAQGRSLEAAQAARESELEAVRAGFTPKLPEVYRMLGRIAATEGDPDAFVFFERALEIIHERGLPALEKAQTLQAYAASESLVGDATVARQLLGGAKEVFDTLGVTHMRQAWADVFDQDPEIEPAG
jgi:tetratricopeptide (TPR) repeat protein